MTAPILYTNFAVQTISDELISRQGDWHFAPDVLLKWTHQFDWVKLTVGADVFVDRYLKQTLASEDACWSGTVKAASSRTAGVRPVRSLSQLHRRGGFPAVAGKTRRHAA